MTKDKVFTFLIIFSLIIPELIKADVGVGIQWKYEELVLKALEEKCISYII